MTRIAAPSVSNSIRLPQRHGWLGRLLLGLTALLAAALVVTLSTLLFGPVSGLEFSPHNFHRRHYFYFEIPLVRVQAWPITRTYRTRPLEQFLTQQSYMRLPRPGQPRWDLVHRERVGKGRVEGDAAIVCDYLDAEDEDGQLYWLDWSKTHPRRAKLLWPAVAEVSQQGLYLLVPQLFLDARQSSSATQLRAKLSASLSEGYGWLAEQRQRLGDHSVAVDLYTRALKHNPSSLNLFRGRAKSHAAAGHSDKAAEDLDQAEQLAASRAGAEIQMGQIYLDNNSTSQMLPQVADALAQCYRQAYVNPASQHELGRRARRALEDARDEVASLLGARLAGRQADRVVFTSGGTESNNLALRGLAGRPPARVIISSIEHPSVAAAAEQLQQSGFDVAPLRVHSCGVVDLEHLGQLLTAETRLVSVMLANHETGVIQPIGEIAQLCRARGALLHTDAVQAAGKIPLNFQQLGAAAMSVSAHKLHGPIGIGALLTTGDAPLRPILFGGAQQLGIRPGTESVALVVAMACALRLFRAEQQTLPAQLAQLRDRLEQSLVQGFPAAVVNGRDAPRLPHATNVSFPGLDRQALVMALDQAGVACSSGSACTSLASEPSRVLVAMQLPSPLIHSALRLSVSRLTRPLDIDQAADRILKVVKHLQSAGGAGNLSVTSRRPSGEKL